MDVTSPRPALRFRTPEDWFTGVDAKGAAALLSAPADITLIVNREDVVIDLAAGGEEGADLGFESWFGKPWADRLVPDSREKARQLVEEADAVGQSRRREINHRAPDGTSVPASCTGVRLRSGLVAVFCRDLGGVSRLQQRMIDIQRSMERDYGRLRSAETRYRLLFQLSTETMLVVDAASGRVEEANPAAGYLFGIEPSRLQDRPFRDLFEPDSAPAVDALVSAARALGRAEDTLLNRAGAGLPVVAAASLFRQDGQPLLLVRLSAHEGHSDAPVVRAALTSQAILHRLPEAFAVVDGEGHLMDANAAFLDLAGLAAFAPLKGSSIGRWLGRPGIDLDLLLASVREHGAVRDFASLVRGELGGTEDVDVTAVAATDAPDPAVGILMRPVRRRGGQAFARQAGLSPSVENLTQLVGTMPLKDLVRETTDMIEQMCIEAALKLTDDNRASAAQILGLSRQSLYAKLHRFGLGDLGSDEG